MNNKSRKPKPSNELPKLTALVGIICLCLFFATTAFGQQTETMGGELPTLTGEKAVEFLKQNGEYEQFAAAFDSMQSEEKRIISNFNHRRFIPFSATIPTDGQPYVNFGASLAISGNTMIVGTWSGIYGNGAAYIFVRSGRNWVQEARLTPNGGAAEDSFGVNVALSGNTAIVSAPRTTVSVPYQGAVYVYSRSGTTWTQQERIVNNTPIQGEYFGNSLDIDGNTLIIGSPASSAGSVPGAGKINVYQKNGSVWDLTTSIFAAESSPNLGFGAYIRVKGDTLVVGARSGSEYIYRKINNIWNFQLISALPQGEFEPGQDIDISDKFIVIAGAQTLKTLKRTGISWEAQPTMFLNNSVGRSLSINNNLLACSTPSINGFTGSVSVYVRSGEQWVLRQEFAPPNIGGDSYFGAELHFGSNFIVSGSGSLNKLYTFVLSSGASDFDGDAADDVSVFRNGNWYLNNSTNGFSAVQFGLNTDRLAPGDFNGDGISDVSVYRSGFWYRIRSGDNVFVQNQFGAATDVPVSGDFNGNGTSDVAVFRSSTGAWFWLLPTLQTVSVQFGVSGDKPVPADYDGDGISDVAVFRPSNGNWYWLNSSNGEFRAVAFGQNGDVPVVGDYDGDGRADQAVFRPSNGNWYLLRSTAGFTSVQWGLTADTPVPADYDGDGKTDVAVFRNGVWYLLRSTSGYAAVSFGASGDKPIPAAFLP